MSDLFMGGMQQRRQQQRAARAQLLAEQQQENADDDDDDVDAYGQQLYNRTKRNQAYAEDEDEDEAEEEADPLGNLLSLQLRKPPHWKWELTTSRSCSNIALPRILLYDHTGALLVDANSQVEQSYGPPTPPAQPQRRRSALRKRAVTTNLGQSLRQAFDIDDDFDGLCIAEATPSTTPSRSPLRQQHSGSCIDFSSHQLPDYERRSSSLKGVRFEQPLPLQLELEQEACEAALSYPTPPSTSTLTTTGTTSSSGPREKRRYRRSHSSGRLGGGSILERFSMSKGRHSSPELEQATAQQLQQAPRYYLSTSKAGTLVIKEDSFNRVQQRRRRPRHSSSENVRNESAASSTLPSVATSRKRGCSRRRQRPTPLATSEEEEEEQQQRQQQDAQLRGRRLQRNCGKQTTTQELITVDPENCVYRATPGATAR